MLPASSSVCTAKLIHIVLFHVISCLMCKAHRGTNKIPESRLTVFTSHTNVIKITIPKNGGHFERRAAVGRRNMPHHSTSQYHARTVHKFLLA